MPTHKRIQQRRIAQGLSLEELAAKLIKLLPREWRTINKSVLSKIESGQRLVHPDEVPYFAVALGCEIVDLHDPKPE